MQDVEHLNLQALLAKLPPRKSNAHKGDFGYVLIVGGDLGYPGAPVLSALGALRIGAGLVAIASHKDHMLALNSTHPEIICHAIDDPKDLNDPINKATVIVLGPGLGRSKWSSEVYDFVCTSDKPLVVDADGLHYLAMKPTKNNNRVLTPHPGEAAALLHQTDAIAETKRIKALHALIELYASTIVLKGFGSLVASPKYQIGICSAGNPGMASGGMGDLLSGVIAGLIAQKLDLDSAAKLGVCIHAAAGDIAASSGQRGIIATDLLEPIKNLIQ